jgi:hypothetical protein
MDTHLTDAQKREALMHAANLDALLASDEDDEDDEVLAAVRDFLRRLAGSPTA